jgi:hypothetical protein
MGKIKDRGKEEALAGGAEWGRASERDKGGAGGEQREERALCVRYR